MIVLFPPGTRVRVTFGAAPLRNRQFIVRGRADGETRTVRIGWLIIEDAEDEGRLLEIPDHFVERIPSPLSLLAEAAE